MVARPDTNTCSHSCRRPVGEIRRPYDRAVESVLRVLAAAGGLLVALGLLLVVGAWGGLDERMPTQVPPRRLAACPIVAGLALLVIAAVAAAFP